MWETQVSSLGQENPLEREMGSQSWTQLSNYTFIVHSNIIHTSQDMKTA